MKLKNKKTGEVIDGGDYLNIYDDVVHQRKEWHYNSLAELNEEWEDYKPAEPLIKDEKIRKAVQAWAEALGQRDQFLCIKNGTRLEISDGSPHLLYISFWADKPTLDSIDDRTYYTIAELCGEEEE